MIMFIVIVVRFCSEVFQEDLQNVFLIFVLFCVVADKFDPSKIISGPLGVSVSGISGTPVILQTSISNLR
jgi:hypothetical protein